MSAYRFVSHWTVAGPAEAAWEAIADIERWPTWWRGVERVETLSAGGAHGLGGAWRSVWKGWLPYRLTLDLTCTRSEPPRLLESRADGDLEGRGVCRLTQRAGSTAIRYEWEVRSTTSWMRWLEPAGRLVFAWNHRMVMRAGQRGLRAMLTQGRSG